ncbi:transcription factor S [Haloquadratum walsbyi]|jgi:DNA-directed RNA polymerase subunit M|uniref:Transcription factor S n=3 Tax=Halobacteriales TaxID=2235 RepID=Q18FG8_HALWD|nr:transcription factor S [Haloquadratum walsbyi]ABQ75964.1 DNA-directed RNA polymerase subunit M2 [uncultured haloarchaeon]CAJ53289.1 transcription elongation factor TFS [Haloquadratum walsbyi DSM 16790]
MQFCDECGSMMKKRNEQMVCGSCGYQTDQDSAIGNFVSTQKQTDEDIIETEEGAEFEGKPTDDNVICDECEHTVAWYTIKQTGSADEPPTRFFKCKECGYRWRDYN